MPVLPKFVDIVVNGMSDRLFKVKAFAQDAMSQQKISEYQDLIQGQMIAKPILETIQKKTGAYPFVTSFCYLSMCTDVLNSSHRLTTPCCPSPPSTLETPSMIAAASSRRSATRSSHCAAAAAAAWADSCVMSLPQRTHEAKLENLVATGRPPSPPSRGAKGLWATVPMREGSSRGSGATVRVLRNALHNVTYHMMSTVQHPTYGNVAMNTWLPVFAHRTIKATQTHEFTEQLMETICQKLKFF